MTFSIFVTGTDTGVGKTFVSCLLLRSLTKRHTKVAGMKPVAAGADNEDTLALRAASTVAVPPELDNPVLLRDPLSPHIAAQRQGVTIGIDALVQAHRALQRHADAVVVEGAGGFLVPLSHTLTGADLAQALGLPVLLVVGLRLGCLNHALLTQQAIAARGLTLAGWVANRIDPAMDAVDDNIAYLREHIAAPLLADVAHGAASIDFQLAGAST